jgi:hypothetical protein
MTVERRGPIRREPPPKVVCTVVEVQPALRNDASGRVQHNGLLVVLSCGVVVFREDTPRGREIGRAMRCPRHSEGGT